MRAKEDFKRKTKNSFIYFQIGLITTMVIALFILEANFKDVIKKTDAGWLTPIVDDPFVYNPAEPERQVEKVKPVQPVAKVQPQATVPDVIEEFDLQDDDVAVENPDVATQDVTNPVEANPVASNTSSAATDVVDNSPKNMLTVEQLPMFKACKGLSRSEQKACFDAQLYKAILKNLVYPARDHENGKQGTALIEFIIDENGNITNVKAIENRRGATDDMKIAAEKAVKKVPQLIPAKQGNKNVKIKYSIPITFKVN
ncbi:energy transducer TonB [Flavobacterium sp. J27]|uniref:energy transducer TonB n=1 Tax=Flavobacterium sp. J27 TaxID=2060419 RepID=UPI001031C473|nr:energy transducer TonB [Flavobacterium sp. J27]